MVLCRGVMVWSDCSDAVRQTVRRNGISLMALAISANGQEAPCSRARVKAWFR